MLTLQSVKVDLASVDSVSEAIATLTSARERIDKMLGALGGLCSKQREVKVRVSREAKQHRVVRCLPTDAFARIVVGGGWLTHGDVLDAARKLGHDITAVTHLRSYWALGHMERRRTERGFEYRLTASGEDSFRKRGYFR